MEGNNTEEVYSRIRQMIINGTFPMGSKLSETLIADVLKANLAPVRDALKRLKAENLVVRVPKSGTYVFSMSQIDLDQLLRFRLLIEREGIRLSCARNATDISRKIQSISKQMAEEIDKVDIAAYLSLDATFHHVLVEDCGNRYLLEAFASIEPIMDTVRNYLGANVLHLKRSLAQHQALGEMIASGEIEKAVQMLADHILPERGSFWKESNLKGKLPKYSKTL